MKKIIFAVALLACACTQKSQITLLPESAFQAEVGGKATSLYTIRGGDITMQVTNFGARVVSIWAPDRDGNYADVATGYENIDKYINNPGERFLGACVGPVANRIGKGTFTLDGVEYNTPLNNDGNTLHGGFIGVDMMVWDVVSTTDSSICFHLCHPDMQEGWPGNLDIDMTYTVTADNGFKITYAAVTDKATPVNISNHSFFNLTGDSSHDILSHEVMINASRTTPIDNLLIPSGEVVSLDGSPLDFRTEKIIGRDVNTDDVQMDNGYGYDHNWCLDRTDDGGLQLAATVYEPESGRLLEVWTDQPGLQFYCGNFFDGTVADKYGNMIGYRCSIALETQKWPDGINHPNFPDTVLRPGETYTHTCVYRFSAR